MEKEIQADKVLGIEVFAKRIKERRTELNITQGELARLVWPDVFADVNM